MTLPQLCALYRSHIGLKMSGWVMNCLSASDLHTHTHTHTHHTHTHTLHHTHTHTHTTHHIHYTTHTPTHTHHTPHPQTTHTHTHTHTYTPHTHTHTHTPHTHTRTYTHISDLFVVLNQRIAVNFYDNFFAECSARTVVFTFLCLVASPPPPVGAGGTERE